MARLKLLANDCRVGRLLYRTPVEKVSHFDSEAMDTGKIGKDKLSSSSACVYIYVVQCTLLALAYE